LVAEFLVSFGTFRIVDGKYVMEVMPVIKVHRCEDVWGSKGKLLSILNFGTRLRSMESFMLRPFLSPHDRSYDTI
jgi:hypothetical protein